VGFAWERGSVPQEIMFHEEVPKNFELTFHNNIAWGTWMGTSNNSLNRKCSMNKVFKKIELTISQ